MPEVTALLARPSKSGLIQPRPWCSTSAASGGGPSFASTPLPWVLPTVWPPAVRAAVSSSFIAMRAKVTRTSWADFSGSGLPSRPSGFT